MHANKVKHIKCYFTYVFSKNKIFNKAGNSYSLNWHADAMCAAYSEDIRNQTGLIFIISKGLIASSSTKQKHSMHSSAENILNSIDTSRSAELKNKI